MKMPQHLTERSGKTRAHGLTLVELVTGIVLLGLLLSFAAPRFPDNQIFRDRGYVDELASAVRHAQRVAISSSCDVQFQFAPAGYSVWQRTAVLNDCNPIAPWTVPVLRADGTQVAGATPSGTPVNQNVTITFNRQGGVANGVPPVLLIGPFRLTTNQATGRVTVQ